VADRQLIFEHVSAFRTTGAHEQASHPDQRSEAKTTSSTSSKPLKFLRGDPSDDSTTH
jgi:hypothetical protein